MASTSDGFKIAEKDLELRGPGDISGTRQSGLMNFKLVNITQDKHWLDLSKDMAERLLTDDPVLGKTENNGLREYLQSVSGKTAWSKIS
jgi:ATP-dependent DNA helicase RecG